MVSGKESLLRNYMKVRENILKKTESYKRHADKGRKEIVFEPGEWVWLHLRPERFPDKRSSKLAPRGDGPFKVLEKINDTAYRLELPGEFNVSHSFNVTDLSHSEDAGETILRSKPLEEGGNDEDNNPTKTLEDYPVVKDSPMTRSKTRRLREGFNEAVETLLNTMNLGDLLTPHLQMTISRATS